MVARRVFQDVFIFLRRNKMPSPVGCKVVEKKVVYTSSWVSRPVNITIREYYYESKDDPNKVTWRDYIYLIILSLMILQAVFGWGWVLSR
jgi:hypothetical protein